jgi:hypothetical protein
MPHKYAELFPYKNRALGLQEFKVDEREQRVDFGVVAKIAIANLIVDDKVDFPSGTIQVTDISDTEIRYQLTKSDGQVFNEAANASTLGKTALLQGFETLLRKSVPDYTSPLCQIVERDPAIFRLQNQEGWVVGDALCLMAGNVSYPIGSTKFPSIVLEPPNHTSALNAPQQSFGF